MNKHWRAQSRSELVYNNWSFRIVIYMIHHCVMSWHKKIRPYFNKWQLLKSFSAACLRLPGKVSFAKTALWKRLSLKIRLEKISSMVWFQISRSCSTKTALWAKSNHLIIHVSKIRALNQPLQWISICGVIWIVWKSMVLSKSSILGRLVDKVGNFWFRTQTMNTNGWNNT